MMAAFLATLYTLVKLQAKREQNTCFIIGLQKCHKDQTTEQVFALFLNVFLIKRLCISQLSAPKR